MERAMCRNRCLALRSLCLYRTPFLVLRSHSHMHTCNSRLSLVHAPVHVHASVVEASVYAPLCCTVYTCTCDNGIPASGPACTANIPKCGACDAGFGFVPSTNLCEQCAGAAAANPQWNAAVDKSPCGLHAPCTTDQYFEYDAAGASADQCVSCAVGWHQPAGHHFETSCVACEGCPTGTWRDACGGGSAGSCASCDNGTYKPSGASDDFEWDDTCVACGSCPPGEFRSGCVEGGDGGYCQTCAVGKFKAGGADGAWDAACLDCESCGAGQFRSGCGADSGGGTCVACAAGHFKALGDAAPWNEQCAEIGA